MPGGGKPDAGTPARKPRKPKAASVAAAADVESVAAPAPKPRARKPKAAPASVAATPAAAATPPVALCANCGRPLAGHYCHDCGQKAHLHNRLSHLLEEMVEGIAHFDGRLWRTLPVLTLNPGRLSREWIAGRRARYVAPLHVFLFAVFLLFLVPTLTGHHILVGDGHGQPAAIQFDKTSGAEQAPAYRALEKAGGKVLGNPQYYGYKIEGLAYKLSFMVVPISMGILALIAFRRRFTLYDHAVVTLYGLGFTALLFTLVTLLSALLGGDNGLVNLIGTLVFFGLIGHSVWHLRGAYGFSWVGAALRGLVLGLLSLFGFGLFLLGVVALGLAG